MLQMPNLSSGIEASTYADNDSFCVAPWLHLHVSSSGRRRLCCVSAYPKNHEVHDQWISHSEFINSEYMKNIRRQMMEGKYPKECKECANHPGYSYQNALNERFSKFKKSILDNTLSDGTNFLPSVFLDYRTNLCNLSCRTCDEEASRTWQKHLTKHSETYSTKMGLPLLKLEKEWKQRKTFVEYAQKEFGQLLEGGQIIDIYFAGGEPTLEQNHLEKLEKIIKLGHAPKIRLFYNTNLTSKREFLEQWLPALKEFESVNIQVSIDGYGATAEYIRSGLKWSAFEENLNYLKANTPANVIIMLDPTITSLLMTDLVAFSDFCIRTNVPVLAKWMRHNLTLGGHLRVEFLPRHVRLRLLEQWLKYFNLLEETDKQLLANFKDTLLMCLELEDFAEDNFSKTHRMFQITDPLHARGSFEKLLCRNPVAKDWFDEMENKYVL